MAKFKVFTDEESSFTVEAASWAEPKEGSVYTKFFDETKNPVAAFNTADVVAIFEVTN